MAIAIEFNPSAFKHGISEEDIQTAIERFIYNKIDVQTINVFHAMKCRKAYFSLAEEHIRRLLWQE